MDFAELEQHINEILNGTRNLPQFNQPEHAGVCSAGPLLVGALLVCDNARKSLSASCNAPNGQGTSPSNWEIDEVQEKFLQTWAESNGVNYLSERLRLEDMHPANVFVEPLTGLPICIDCIVRFR